MALFEVIKKNKIDENIVWRYPKRNINTGSKLLVQESEEAILFSSGKALDLFGPGKHTLSTNNIPLLKAIINIPTGGRTPFPTDIYFIDKTVQQYKWGTPSKLEFLDPVYNFPIHIGACGELRFHIEDARKLLVKLVGNKKNLDSENVDDFFESQILVKIKSYLTQMIKKEKICIFEIDSKLDRISDNLNDLLTNDFLEYGIKLDKFFVTNIAKPEEEKQYLKFKELFFKQGILVADAEVNKKLQVIEYETEASKIELQSEAIAKKRKLEGYSYQEEKGFEVGKEMAKNEAVGQFTNMGIGLGIMSSVSSNVGENVSKQVTGAFMKENQIECSVCKTKNSVESKFCKACGELLTSRRICETCKAPLEIDAIFCSKCGKKVNINGKK